MLIGLVEMESVVTTTAGKLQLRKVWSERSCYTMRTELKLTMSQLIGSGSTNQKPIAKDSPLQVALAAPYPLCEINTDHTAGLGAVD